jgi:predicted nucleotidyltransferase
MTISHAEMEVYRRSARRQTEKLQAAVEARHQRAWQAARAAARILKDEFGASRVAVYGSLIHPERFHLRSDVDLAVWDVKQYFRAIARLLDIDPEIEFDLVPVEDARPHVRAVIDREGVEL